MPLSCIPRVDADHVKMLLSETMPALENVRKIKDNVLDIKARLGTYKDESTIDSCFRVETKRSDEYNYLVWADSGEEVILQVEGVLLEGYVPPVLSSGAEYSNRLNDLIQSVLISSDGKDQSFMDAVGAIEAIRYFMSRFNRKASMFYPARIDNIVAIRAETRLLTPLSRVKTEIANSDSVDSGNVLKDILAKGTHQYTEDNVVDFMKWERGNDGTISMSAMNPTMLRPSHIVDVGVCFRMLKLQNRVRFMVRLDSVVVMERVGAEILKAVTKQANHSHEYISPPPKKRHVHFKGTNITAAVPSINVDVDGLSDMLSHAMS